MLVQISGISMNIGCYWFEVGVNEGTFVVLMIFGVCQTVPHMVLRLTNWTQKKAQIYK